MAPAGSPSWTRGRAGRRATSSGRRSARRHTGRLAAGRLTAEHVLGVSRGRLGAPGSERAQLLGALDRELRKVTGQSVLFSQAVAERLGMNPADPECLGFLYDESPVPAGRLAELTGLTTGAITGVVDRLEQAGYVRREKDPHDRRRVIIQPLPERVRQITPLFDSMAHAMAELYARYDERELAIILDFITRANSAAFEETARMRAAATRAAAAGSVPARVAARPR
jgi:DNA-binding MarR family transcriptional regulator